jgi:hypothetical protein
MEKQNSSVCHFHRDNQERESKWRKEYRNQVVSENIFILLFDIRMQFEFHVLMREVDVELMLNYLYF